MNLPLFFSRRIFSENSDVDAQLSSLTKQRKSVSKPAIHIATIGVAIGLAVMIVSVSVVLGFKNTIRDKVTGFGSHIQVENILNYSSASINPICIDDSMLNVLNTIPGVKHAERYDISQGILKTDSDFLGIALKGIGPEYDITFLTNNLLAGKMPKFSDKDSSYKLVISQTIANRLSLNVDDRVFAYFIDEDGAKARRFTVAAIYQTNMKRFDDSFCFTDIITTNKLNGWFDGQCSGAELIVDNLDNVNITHRNVIENVNRTYDRYNNIFTSRTIYEVYPQVFSWLNLLDINVWIILGLMIILAGFTMISGLLIIILERTQMIGLLKALGARNIVIRKIFLWFATFIIGRGLLFGNIIGLGIIFLQKTTGLIKLDPQAYYVSEIPFELNIWIILLINVVTLLISVIVLIGPSYLISTIRPARSMRYE